MHSLGNWSFHNVVIDLSSGQRPHISGPGEHSIDAVSPISLGKNDFTTAFGVRFVEFSGDKLRIYVVRVLTSSKFRLEDLFILRD